MFIWKKPSGEKYFGTLPLSPADERIVKAEVSLSYRKEVLEFNISPPSQIISYSFPYDVGVDAITFSSGNYTASLWFEIPVQISQVSGNIYVSPQVPFVYIGSEIESSGQIAVCLNKVLIQNDIPALELSSPIPSGTAISRYYFIKDVKDPKTLGFPGGDKFIVPKQMGFKLEVKSQSSFVLQVTVEYYILQPNL